MKTRITLLATVLVLSYSNALSQQLDNDTYLGAGIFSIDVPTDPRSVAMGESFVAVYANPQAMLSNPAGLAAVKNVSIGYSRRTMNWIADGMQYSSISATIPTSLFNVGLLYNRFFQGEFIVSSSSNPDGNGTKALVYDHTFGIGVAKEIDDHFGIGVSIKTFNMVESYSGPDAALYDINKSKTLPILFDFGFLYNNAFDRGDKSYQHHLSAGFSLQNIGSPLKQTQRVSLTSQQEREITFRVPQCLRLGASYGFTEYGATSDALNPVRLLVTFEYRNAINTMSGNPKRDYWGVGCEVQLFEIASVRIGGFSTPLTSIYGNEGKTAVRYGFGLNAPIQKFNENFPITFSLDYAAIPLNDLSYISSREKTLHAFSVRLQHEGELF